MTDDVSPDELLYISVTDRGEQFYLDPFHKILDRDDQVL